MVKNPDCKINPKTGKLYTRHLYRQTNLKVASYKTMHNGEIVPGVFEGDLVCKRCGFESRFSY